jgi:hypothetical protein
MEQHRSCEYLQRAGHEMLEDFEECQLVERFAASKCPTIETFRCFDQFCTDANHLFHDDVRCRDGFGIGGCQAARRISLRGLGSSRSFKQVEFDGATGRVSSTRKQQPETVRPPIYNLSPYDEAGEGCYRHSSKSQLITRTGR